MGTKILTFYFKELRNIIFKSPRESSNKYSNRHRNTEPDMTRSHGVRHNKSEILHTGPKTTHWCCRLELLLSGQHRSLIHFHLSRQNLLYYIVTGQAPNALTIYKEGILFQRQSWIFVTYGYLPWVKIPTSQRALWGLHKIFVLYWVFRYLSCVITGIKW